VTTSFDKLVKTSYPSAIEVVSELLQWDPAKRPTANALLTLPFYSKPTNTSYIDAKKTFVNENAPSQVNNSSLPPALLSPVNMTKRHDPINTSDATKPSMVEPKTTTSFNPSSFISTSQTRLDMSTSGQYMKSSSSPVMTNKQASHRTSKPSHQESLSSLQQPKFQEAGPKPFWLGSEATKSSSRHLHRKEKTDSTSPVLFPELILRKERTGTKQLSSSSVPPPNPTTVYDDDLTVLMNDIHSLKAPADRQRELSQSTNRSENSNTSSLVSAIRFGRRKSKPNVASENDITEHGWGLQRFTSLLHSRSSSKNNTVPAADKNVGGLLSGNVLTTQAVSAGSSIETETRRFPAWLH
jgi:hypothetical protein